VTKNALSAIAQSIASALILLAVYGVVVGQLGPEALGVWALVLASTSAGRVAALGMSGSVVKYVAEYLGRDNAARAAHIVETSILSVTLLTMSATAAIWPAGRALLRWLLDEEAARTVAVALLPYAMASLVLGQMQGPIVGALDGVARIDLRSATVVSGLLVYLGAVLVLIGPYGLRGLAAAQILQQVWVLVVGWLLLRREIPISALPYRWRIDCFRETIGYSLNFQLIALTQLFFEPLIKGLIEAFDGLAAVGIYEVASRIVSQLRAIILAGFSALVPHLARTKAADGVEDESALATSTSLTFMVGLPVLAMLMPAAMIVGPIWFVETNQTEIFSVFLILLALGWVANLVSAPAYFLNLANGEIQINTLSNFAILLTNVTLGVLFGRAWGGVGVVIAWCVALMAGATVILRRTPNSAVMFRSPANVAIMIGVIVVFGASLGVAQGLPSALTAFALTAAGAALMLTLGVRHPDRAPILLALREHVGWGNSESD